MDWSLLYTNDDGTIDIERYESFKRSGKRFAQHRKNRHARVKLLVNRFNIPPYFSTELSEDRRGKFKDVPNVLYEDSKCYSLIDFMINFLEEKLGVRYNYLDHKQIITEMVSYFNIKPDLEPKTFGSEFKDNDGNIYSYNTLWFYLCRFVLNEEKNNYGI